MVIAMIEKTAHIEQCLIKSPISNKRLDCFPDCVSYRERDQPVEKTKSIYRDSKVITIDGIVIYYRWCKMKTLSVDTITIPTIPTTPILFQNKSLL